MVTSNPIRYAIMVFSQIKYYTTVLRYKVLSFECFDSKIIYIHCNHVV